MPSWPCYPDGTLRNGRVVAKIATTLTNSDGALHYEFNEGYRSIHEIDKDAAFDDAFVVESGGMYYVVNAWKEIYDTNYVVMVTDDLDAACMCAALKADAMEGE